MEITIDTLINIATLLLGSSGGAFFTWKWIRRKSQAEASQAENEALKGKQDYYQQMMDDIAKDRDYYKKERDCMRDTIKSYDTRIDDLERKVARNGRMVESLRPFICTDLSCKLRHRAVISANGEIDTTEQQPTSDDDNDESK